jgi:hypothetical protein
LKHGTEAPRPVLSSQPSGMQRPAAAVAALDLAGYANALPVTLGKPLGRFSLGSWAEAVAFPVVQISEPLPIINDAHKALGFVGVRLLVGPAR